MYKLKEQSLAEHRKLSTSPRSHCFTDLDILSSIQLWVEIQTFTAKLPVTFRLIPTAAAHLCGVSIFIPACSRANGKLPGTGYHRPLGRGDLQTRKHRSNSVLISSLPGASFHSALMAICLNGLNTLPPTVC